MDWKAIMAVAIVGIITAGIYGLFDLFVRRKERLAIIEKLGDKLLAASSEVKIPLPQFSPIRFSFSALKTGCLLTGIGLGLLVACIVSLSIQPDYENWHTREAIGTLYGASVLLFGGAGLITAFVIELKLSKEKKNHSDAE